MQHRGCLVLCLLFASLGSGCMFNGGMQVRAPAPEAESVLTGAGLDVQVVSVTANNLPQIRKPRIPAELTQLMVQSVPDYRLAVGDQLQVQLWFYPEITPPLQNANQYTVYADGTIKFPLVGYVRAAGKSLPEFQRDLERALSRYLKEPDVQIQVTKYQGRSIFVGGEVNRQGEYPLADKTMSLYQAIGLAGGLTAQADNQYIRLIRNQKRYDLDVSALEDAGYSLHRLYLRQGDTIQVMSRESKKAYVMGEVGKTTSVPIPEQKLSLTQLLAESQGINAQTAQSSKVYILRDRNPSEAVLYHLDLSNFANMSLANRFMIEPNDLIYVDASGLARWSRVVNLLLPSAAGLRTAQTIGNGN